MSRKQISAQTRGLGAELKELRNKAGLNTREAAKRVGLSAPTVNRIELGSRVASPEEVFGLLVIYDAPVLERERLLEMARGAAMPGWWEGSTYAGVSKHLAALTNFESDAVSIANMEPSAVPGLLQIPDYIRAVLASLGMPEVEAEKLVAMRAGRQMVLSRRRPPRYHAIIDEAALRRRVCDPATMAEQIRHVLKMMERSNVMVQLASFDLGMHEGMVSPFTMIEFEKSPAVVYLEHLHSSVFLDQPIDTQPFQRAIQSLARHALQPADSAKMLAAVAAEYERE